MLFVIHFQEEDDDWICFATLNSHESTVWSLAFDSTGTRIASVSEDLTLKVWREFKVGNREGISAGVDDPTWKCVATLGGYHKRCPYDVDWCHKSGLIATACGDNGIRLFKMKADDSYELVCCLEDAHSQDVNCVAWNPVKEGILASTSDDGEIKIWKIIGDADDEC